MGVPGYIYKSYTFLPILDVNQPLYFTKFYIGFRTTSKGSIVIYIWDVNVAILDM